MNAIAASRVAKPFTKWRLYDPARQAGSRHCLLIVYRCAFTTWRLNGPARQAWPGFGWGTYYLIAQIDWNHVRSLDRS